MIAASVMKELIISYIIAFKTRTNEHVANGEDPVKRIQPGTTCSKSSTETTEQDLKYLQS